MALLQEWREYAYSEEMQNSKEGQKLWENYFTLEKGIYEKLLANPSEIVEGTVQELADRYEVPLSMMVGFLDGINDSLKEANPIDEMEKDTQVKLDIDLEKLYYNMVECKAEWLYTLPQWNDILPEDKRDAAMGVLSHDPRPSYQRKPDRIYGLTFAGFDLRFQVKEDILTVVEVDPA